MRTPARTALGWALSYLLLRCAFAALPGYVSDLRSYQRWALHAAREGVTQVYRTSDFDYPPLYAYLLWPLGKVYALLAPEAFARMGESTLLAFLIKQPPLFFDLLIGAILLWWGRDLERGGEPRVELGRWTLGSGAMLSALYLLNPAVLWDSAYWGQPDSIHSAFVLAAFLALAAGARGGPPPVLGRLRGPAAAWSCLTLATLMKPLGAPFFPVLLILTFAWSGGRGVLTGVAAAALTAILLISPFLLFNPWMEFFGRLLGDVGAMPYTSVNAHNLWWALGAWQDAEVPWLGPFTATHVGLALFVALLGAIAWLARARHHEQPHGLSAAQGLLLALLSGLGFFMVSTHMHENHMFAAIPLALPLVALARGRQRATLFLFAAISAGVLMNLVLHDLTVPAHAPFTWGGPSGVENLHLQRPFYVAELWATRFSTAWNLVLFGVILASVFRRGGMFDRLAATA